MRGLSHSHPAVITAYFASVVCLTVILAHPVITSISLAGALLLYFSEKGPGSKRFHLFALVLLLILTLVNPVFSHRGSTVLFVMNDRPVTAEALLYGAFAALMIVSSLYFLSVYSFMMTEDKLFALFGVFSPKLALLFTMAIRYIPMMIDDAGKIDRAQRTIGLYSADNLFDRLKGKIKVFSILVTRCLENGVVTADSMTARGYGIRRRKAYTAERFSLRDAILLAVILALTAGAVVCALNKAFAFSYYPSFCLEMNGPITIAGYALFGALCLLPTVLITAERIKWNYCISKI